MAKHLPPSASRLRLWDVGGTVGADLADLRVDLDITSIETLPDDPDPDTVDSIMALAPPEPLAPAFLRAALRALRPGGRLVIVDPDGTADKAAVKQLEEAGHTRILVEQAPVGVLLRGEKPHTTDSTFARIRSVAKADEDNLTLASFDGPYVFTLVSQMPNKPVWKLGPDEQIRWQGVTATVDGETHIVAFTSLPKAVGLMQPAVMADVVRDVNKVGKFRREVALGWEQPVLLNPTIERLRAAEIGIIELDPTTAESPDE